jgi:sulfite reductase beta subunit-like hemoprotein
VQGRALARLAARYAPQRLSFTTRQSAQLHRLKLPDLPQLLRDLHAANLTAFHGCGDVTRNVAACSWASICPHRRFDVLPYAQVTAKLLTDCRDLDNLPRKFKITFSGCPGDCGQPSINCVGLTAITRRRLEGGEENGFRVRIGGGLGWRAFLAQEVFSFIPADKAAQVCRAVGQLFRDYGDRQIRMYARLKFVVQRLGIEQCRQIVIGNLDRERVDRSDFEISPVEDCRAPVPARPQTLNEPFGDNGRAIQRIMIPKGEIDAPHLLRIAELAEIYGDKYVYSTNRQNLEIHEVDPARLPELGEEIATLGFRTEGFHGLQDVVACVGTTYCPLAVSCTHEMFDRLQSVVHQERYAPIRDRVQIHISGCPNSCSQFQIGDIGLRGLRIREQVGSTEGYQISVGGDLEHFGQVLGDLKTDDCPRVVTTILDTFLEYVRQTGSGDTLAGHVLRGGVGPYRQAVEQLGIRYDRMAENPLELSVFTGQGDGPGHERPRYSVPGGVPGEHPRPRVHSTHCPRPSRGSPPDQPGG